MAGRSEECGKGTVLQRVSCCRRRSIRSVRDLRTAKAQNPEELIAAAHAGCFTMALSAQLGSAGMVPDKLETTATLSFEKLEAGWTVTQIHLDVKGKVPKADQVAWEKATDAAKDGCPISRLLNTTITMEAKLEG